MYHKHRDDHECCHEKRPFKIEAVVVCRDYSDFLACTLPFNKQLFDRIVVVTSTKDKETQKLCEFNHVQCVKAPTLDDEGFFKGEAINFGLANLSMDGWVVQLDADIFLPPQTRRLLERAELAEYMLYGIDRFIVPGAKAWQDFVHSPKLQHECEAYIHLNNSFPVGTRVMTYEDGYIPIGFFQMWNPKRSGIYNYPSGHSNAGRTDMLFAKQWPREARSFIPEIVAYHLESGANVPMGANWDGRKTAPFKVLEEKTLWQKIRRMFE